jgi:drug/metabolite transporter (DMT)-like permease
VATVVGVLFLGERVTPFFLLGSALVLGGVILVNRARQAAAAMDAKSPRMPQKNEGI